MDWKFLLEKGFLVKHRLVPLLLERVAADFFMRKLSIEMRDIDEKRKKQQEVQILAKPNYDSLK